MEKKLGFGIIGCGMISKWHAHAIASQKDAVLVGATSASLESAERFAAEHNCKVFPSVEDMLSSEEIDVVCICTPSGLHASMAVMAANAKKHFVVEKPMAITEAQVQDILLACQKNGVKGAVISQLRFSKAVQLVKKAIEDGVLGQLLTGDVSMKYYRSPEYYASAGWRGTWEMDGGGALMNQGIHGIDLLCGLMGYPKQISGHVATLYHKIEVEDTAVASLVFPSGALGVIEAGTAITHSKPRHIEICGEYASVTIEEDVLISAEGIDLVGGTPTEIQSWRNPAAISADLHTAQYRNICAAIRGEEALSYCAVDAINAVNVILAIYESSETGKTITFES